MYPNHKRYNNSAIEGFFEQVIKNELSKEDFIDRYKGRVIALLSKEWSNTSFFEDMVQEALYYLLKADFNEAEKPMQWLALQVYTAARTVSRRELLMRKTLQSEANEDVDLMIELCSTTEQQQTCSIDPILNELPLTDLERKYLELKMNNEDTGDLLERYNLKDVKYRVFKNRLRSKLKQPIKELAERKLFVSNTSAGRVVFEKIEPREGYIWGAKILNLKTGTQTRHPALIGCYCLPAKEADKKAWFGVFR